MKRLFTQLLLALALVVLAGCSSSSSTTGSAQFAVSVPQRLSSSISRVSVTLSAAESASVSVELVPSNGVWGGFLGNIAAGPNRSFLAQAFDSAGTRLFEGSVSGVSIAADQTVLVAMTLQQVNAPPPFQNAAPFIDSLVASSTSVAAGSSLSLAATAHDPNPADTLSYAWSSTAGSFSSAAALATSWTAPDAPGIQTLTFTVTDSGGLSSRVSLNINVLPGGGQGNAQLSISFNTFPQVSAVGATVSQLSVGQTTAVSVSASDGDGDSLSYAWSASCAGSWAQATSQSAQFTPSELPASACNNCNLTVAVSDGRGGQTTGTVALCVANTAPSNHFNPVIVSSFRSSDTASAAQVLTFEVMASDPEGSALSFSWAASAGTLGTAANGASSSRVTWTAPPCGSASTAPVITATVTNAFTLSATKSFAVTGLPACHWAPTGSLASARSDFTATRLLNGKVLVAGGRNLATAELYDPASGTWSATGSMAFPHFLHTATLLPNGKVLVAGGAGGPYGSTELYDPDSGTWSTTGSMALSHIYHTATLLSDGRVLVAGSVVERLTAAEVYDPASGTWSTTGDMGSPRFLHKATLLPNGRVLVTGGINQNANGVPSASAEEYDPASGTWSPVGSMASPRYLHTATLLPNGRVLVAGKGSFPPILSAEEYDPASGTWSVAGAMVTPRSNHTATLLPNGKVLVAGGGADGATVATAEEYDPTSGTWSPVGAMVSPRSGHTATLLLNGQVLVTGGAASSEVYTPHLNPRILSFSRSSDTASAGQVLTLEVVADDPEGSLLSFSWAARTGSLGTVVNGASSTRTTWTAPSCVRASAPPRLTATVTNAFGMSTTQSFLVTGLPVCADGWVSTGSMSSSRFGATATLLPSGKVLVVGGSSLGTFSSFALATAEVYDPASGTWSVTGSMSVARSGFTATLLPNGKVLVAGGVVEGTSSYSYLATAEVYDPVSGTWSATGSMASSRQGHVATLLPNGTVLVSEGNDGAGYLATAEVYDPASGAWSTANAMAPPRAAGSETLLANGTVLAAGGYNGEVFAAAQVYDPASRTWSATGSMLSRRAGPTATLLSNGKVLVSGGNNSDGYLATAEVYDPASGTWSATGSMALPRRDHTLTLLPNGKVLAVGGSNGDFVVPVAVSELYDPVLGIWSVADAMSLPRNGATATLLPNGKVLVAGGAEFNNGYLATAELYTPEP